MLSELDLRPDRHPATSVDRSSPVFVVGEPGGGQRLRELLDAHPDISCPPETPWLAALASATWEGRDALSHYGYPEQYWLASIARFYDAIQQDYASGRRTRRWVDTAPGIDLDLIDRLFPRCQVIYVVPEMFGRRPAIAWASGRRNRRAGSLLSQGRYLEVRAGDIETRPAASLRSVLEFLGEAPDAVSP